MHYLILWNADTISFKRKYNKCLNFSWRRDQLNLITIKVIIQNSQNIRALMQLNGVWSKVQIAHISVSGKDILQKKTKEQVVWAKWFTTKWFLDYGV